MSMQIRTADPLRADILQDARARFAAGTARIPEDCYQVKAKAGALFVDPINRDPFVFVAPDKIYEFVSEPRNGTDKLRMRAHASQFFEALCPTSTNP